MDQALCNDVEAEQECLEANKRLDDTKTSFINNAGLFLSGMIVQGRLSAEGASYLRTQLSIAIDQDIPRADCSAIATQTVVKNTLSHCYSLSLLYQCALMIPAAANWTAGIAHILNESIANNPQPVNINASVSNAFVAAMGARAAANTVDINCSYFDSAIDSITNSKARASLSSLAALFIVLACIL